MKVLSAGVISFPSSARVRACDRFQAGRSLKFCAGCGFAKVLHPKLIACASCGEEFVAHEGEVYGFSHCDMHSDRQVIS